MLSLGVTHIYILIHAHAHIRTKGKQSLKMLLLPLGVCVGWVIYKREYVRGGYKREYVRGGIKGRESAFVRVWDSVSVDEGGVDDVLELVVGDGELAWAKGVGGDVVFVVVEDDAVGFE